MSDELAQAHAMHLVLHDMGADLIDQALGHDIQEKFESIGPDIHESIGPEIQMKFDSINENSLVPVLSQSLSETVLNIVTTKLIVLPLVDSSMKTAISFDAALEDSRDPIVVSSPVLVSRRAEGRLCLSPKRSFCLRNNKREREAALTIQRCFRGFSIRKSIPALYLELFGLESNVSSSEESEAEVDVQEDLDATLLALREEVQCVSDRLIEELTVTEALRDKNDALHVSISLLMERFKFSKVNKAGGKLQLKSPRRNLQLPAFAVDPESEDQS